MPSGKVHDRITLITAPIVAVGCYLLSHNPLFTVQTTGAYLFAGFMFSGDLDIHSNQTNRWGLLSFLWKPYQMLFKHRSFFTHNFLIGTIVRVIYLYLWVLLFYGAYEYAYHQTMINFKEETLSALEYMKKHPQFFLSFFLGITVGAFSHSFADYISTSIKRTKTKIKRTFFPKRKKGKGTDHKRKR